MKKNQPAPPSNEDIDTWSDIIKDVTKTKQPEVIEKPALELPEIRNNIDLSIAYSGEKLGVLNMGTSPNLDRNTAEKFRRGEFKIERRLDLHGLTEDVAFETVENFIKSAYIQGKRCVLIITGKGLPRPDDDIFTPKGLLREKVPLWLNRSELRPLILSFSHALPKDGGDGALYILLRRQRD